MPAFWTRFDIRQIGRQLALVLLGWLLLNAVFLLVFVRPRVTEYERLREDSSPRLEELARRKAQVEEREAFLAALQQAQEDLKALRAEWLGTRGRQMVPIELELSRLLAEFNISLEQVRYQNSDLKEEGLERWAIVVPLEAGYGNLRRFLQAVETSSKFLVVERVALGQGKEGGSLLQLNITLATYFDAPHLKSGKDSERRRQRMERRGDTRPPGNA